MKQMLFVMNPYAGTRRANRYLPDIITIFNKAGYKVHIFMTQGPGDCRKIVEENAAGMDLVVCAGGDGTLNEAINGLMHQQLDISIGYIPCGSTNDFASALKLPTNVLEAARCIVGGKPKRYDIGLFHNRYFSYVASFGAFTRASYATPQNIKNALGHTAYILSGIQELSQLRTEHIRIETDNQVIEGDYLFGAISNSISLGGIITLDPKQVDMTDGKFELLLVRAPKDLSELSQCIVALQKQNYHDCAMLTFISTPQLRVTAPADMCWSLDGEQENGRREILVSNQHLAISLIQKEKI